MIKNLKLPEQFKDNYKTPIIYKSIEWNFIFFNYDDIYTKIDYGLMAYLLFPQTDNYVILRNIKKLLQWFYTLQTRDINEYISIITNYINNPADKYHTFIELFNSVVWINNNPEWHNFLLQNIKKILIIKRDLYINGDYYINNMAIKGDFILLLLQLFTPIYLDQEFTFAFSAIIVIVDNIFNNDPYLYSDYDKKLLDDFYRNISIIERYDGVYYYKSAIYNYIIWKQSISGKKIFID